MLAAAVVQVAEAKRLAAGQLQTSQRQCAFTAGNGQPFLARFENASGLPLAFAEACRVNLQRFAIQRAVADRPGVEGTDQPLQLDGRARPVDARLVLEMG